MKTGRNDPCPCGSGKKYKNCCLDKDLPQKSSVIEPEKDNSILPIETDLYEPDNDSEPDILSDEEQAMEKLWDEFQDASLAQKLVLLKEMIRTPGFGEFADFAEMFEDLADDIDSQEDVREFLKCVEFYQKNSLQTDEATEGYILAQAVHLCITYDQAKPLQKYFIQLAEYANIIIDTFTKICDKLAYHGHTTLLKEGYRIGWDNVQDSDEIMDWAIDEFMSHNIDAILFSYLEKQKSPRFADTKLQKEIAKLEDIEMEVLEEYFSVIIQVQNKQWNAQDFFIGQKNDIEDSFRKSVWKLCNQFISYLHNTFDINYSRAAMMRTAINRYLISRASGQFSKKIHWKSFKQNANYDKEPMLYTAQALCPDPATADKYMVDFLNIINPYPYKFVAMAEAIPYWLKFLVDIRLIDDAIRLKKLRRFSALQKSITEIVKNYVDEKTVIDDVNKAWLI